jgi:hypothetical protein
LQQFPQWCRAVDIFGAAIAHAATGVVFVPSGFGHGIFPLPWVRDGDLHGFVGSYAQSTEVAPSSSSDAVWGWSGIDDGHATAALA